MHVLHSMVSSRIYSLEKECICLSFIIHSPYIETQFLGTVGANSCHDYGSCAFLLGTVGDNSCDGSLSCCKLRHREIDCKYRLAHLSVIFHFQFQGIFLGITTRAVTLFLSLEVIHASANTLAHMLVSRGTNHFVIMQWLKKSLQFSCSLM